MLITRSYSVRNMSLPSSEGCDAEYVSFGSRGGVVRLLHLLIYSEAALIHSAAALLASAGDAGVSFSIPDFFIFFALDLIFVNQKQDFHPLSIN